MINMITGHVDPQGQSPAKEEVVGARLGHTDAGVFGLILAGGRSDMAQYVKR